MSDWLTAIGYALYDLLFCKQVSVFFAMIVSGMLFVLDMGHPSLRYLLFLMLLDFALGAMMALRSGQFRPSGIRKGLSKFVVYALALMVANITDRGMANYGAGPLDSFTGAFTTWLLINEAISCLRHLASLKPGIVPAWLLKRLESLRDTLEDPRCRNANPHAGAMKQAEEEQPGEADNDKE